MHKYYGQFDPAVDKVIHERYFMNKYDGISIECGAFDGVIDSSCKFFEENYNWITINVEPLNSAFEKLINNRPKSINLNIALSDNNNDKLFTNYKHPKLGYEWGNGSLSHSNIHEKELKKMCGENNYICNVVKCNTYKEIIEKLKLKHVDLFVLDVEGHEFNVIDGMIGCDILPDIFVIEHGHTDTNFLIYKLIYCSHVDISI